MRDGDPWFVASDIAKALWYSNYSKAVQDHCKYVKSLSSNESVLLECAVKDVCNIFDLENTSKACISLDTDAKGSNRIATPGGLQEMLIISESRLYNPIFKSRKPKAMLQGL